MGKEPQAYIYGVLGFPAKHSLSPLMHNAAFSFLNIKAEYRIFEKKPQEIEGFLAALWKEGIRGLNVTVPYKETVISFLSRLSPEAAFTQAANTIVVKEGNCLEGFNTDGVGFLRHLTQDLKFDPQGKIVTLIGAGGAAKAVADQLARAKAAAIFIYDIAEDRCASLCAKLNREFPQTKTTPVKDNDDLELEHSSLVINATPIGMKKGDPLLIDIDGLHPGMLVYDLIYNPAETALLKIAKEKGAMVSNGLGMLLYQGARSFELWTGKAAPLEVMRQALYEGVKKIC